MAKPSTQDYVALRQLAERYVDAVNRFDAAAWEGTWAPDGEWQLGDLFTGRAAIVAHWTRVMQSLPNVFMHVYSGVIDDVEGDRAAGRWYLGEFLHLPDDSRTMNAICYSDTYRRIDGEWCIQTRQYAALYRGPADLSGQFFHLADV